MRWSRNLAIEPIGELHNEREEVSKSNVYQQRPTTFAGILSKEINKGDKKMLNKYVRVYYKIIGTNGFAMLDNFKYHLETIYSPNYEKDSVKSAGTGEPGNPICPIYTHYELAKSISEEDSVFYARAIKNGQAKVMQYIAKEYM